MACMVRQYEEMKRRMSFQLRENAIKEAQRKKKEQLEHLLQERTEALTYWANAK